MKCVVANTSTRPNTSILKRDTLSRITRIRLGQTAPVIHDTKSSSVAPPRLSIGLSDIKGTTRARCVRAQIISLITEYLLQKAKPARLTQPGGTTTPSWPSTTPGLFLDPANAGWDLWFSRTSIVRAALNFPCRNSRLASWVSVRLISRTYRRYVITDYMPRIQQNSQGEGHACAIVCVS